MPRRTDPNLELDQLYSLAVEEPTMVKQASSNRLKFAENQERFSNIGFGLFRDNDSEFLWTLEKDSETGEEFIVRTAQVDPRFQRGGAWAALADSDNKAITLVYRGHAIKAFKKAELNFNEANVDEWRQYLVDKIQTDPTFVGKVLDRVGESRRKFLIGKFPELLK